VNGLLIAATIFSVAVAGLELGHPGIVADFILMIYEIAENINLAQLIRAKL
jgi:hypothetical protein